MANVWTGDPNIISVWRFESGALTADSVGTNTLTAVNVPAEDVVDYKQGTCSTSLLYASKQFFKVTDANLSAGFPLKSGDTVQKISFGCWFKPMTSVSGSNGLIGKSTSTVGIQLHLSNTTTLQLRWNATNYTVGTIALGTWFHVAVMVDGMARTSWVRLYNADTGVATTSIVTTQTVDLTLSADWRIGSWSGLDTTFTFNGKIDEAFVFNRLLSALEVDAIRNGTYEYAPLVTVSANDYSRDISCLTHYRFEPGALTTDSKGSATLVASATAPTSNSVDYKVGTGSVEFAPRNSNYYYITDANLPPYFPATAKVCSSKAFTFCCWLKCYDYYTTASRVIFGKYLASPYSFLCYISSVDQYYRVVLGFSSSSTTTFITNIPNIPNEWLHYSIACDLADSLDFMVRIYRPSTGETFTYNAAFNQALALSCPGDFRIGGNHNTAADLWNGLIDDVVIFTRYLSIDEIDAIRSGTYKGPISPSISTYDQPTICPIPSKLTFGQAAKCPNLSFTFGGNANWGIENNETHSGSFAIKSGAISTDQESWFSTTVNGPGTLRFWWAVDSTADHHYLEFQIDGAAQHSISGPNNPGAWAQKVYSITAGPHTLKWRYYTDAIATSNRNAGWVDQIAFGRANIFSDDSSCKALYNFHNNTRMGTDTIGSNHLYSGLAMRSNTKLYQTGFQSAEFIRNSYMVTSDALLDAGFPLKNGDATKTGTFCFWMYPKTLTGSTYYDIISKGSLGATVKSLGLYFYGSSFRANCGYTGGSQDISMWTCPATYRWYHVSFSFDGVNKRIYLRVWDEEAEQIVCDQVWSPTNALQVGSEPFTLGTVSGGANYFSGLLDEVVIFNRALPIWQMDAVRKGVYSGTGPAQPGNDFTSDSSCKALWKFENGAKTTDSISTNTLTDHSTTQVTDAADTVKEGHGCVYTTFTSTKWLHIADSSLAAGFPLKTGDANLLFSMCAWFRPFENNVSSRHLIWKAIGGGSGTFGIYTNSSTQLIVRWYYSTASTAYQDYVVATLPSTYVWYHLGLTFDGVNCKITARLYNSYTESATYNEFYPGLPINLCAADFTISGLQGATTGTILASSGFNGYVDEVVVFNRILNILEIDDIRQGQYSGTGRQGIAVNHVSAQVAYRTTDRETHFCLSPDDGKDVGYDGLSFTRPWRTPKSKVYAPGDSINFLESELYQQHGTVTVTNGSATVTTSVDLTGFLFQYDVLRFGDVDDTYYSISAISSAAITLYRPYRGTSASNINLYQVGSFNCPDTYQWNTSSNKGYPDKRIKFQCGVNRSSGEITGRTLFNFYNSNYAFYDNLDHIFYSRLASTWTPSYWNFYGAGLVFEDIFTTRGAGPNFPGTYKLQIDRFVCEGGCTPHLNLVTNATINDLEVFTGLSSNGLVFYNASNIIFNRFKCGNNSTGVYFSTPYINNITFYNSIIGDIVSNTSNFYFDTGNIIFYNITFVNTKLDLTATLFNYNSTANPCGDIAFEHYNQTVNDHRTFLYNGTSVQASYDCIMYRDAVTFHTSAPSVRFDLSGTAVLPFSRTFYVPAAANIGTTVSAYVRFNSAYVNTDHFILPSMTLRLISGSIPNFVWVDNTVTAINTPDQWQLLSKAVTPSMDCIIELVFQFQSTNPSAQFWIDDIDVEVPE
jgi:hypothetical protein